MKFNKKMLSLALVFAIMLSCTPGAVFAAVASETASTYDRPTGRSIAVNYDGYMENAGKDWAEELISTLSATATIGGEGEYAITWPSADEVKGIVDPDKVGYYSIPGSVGGVNNAVSATIQVCAMTNLFTNPSFEGNYTGWHANYWQAPANSAAGYSIGMRGPAAVGNYAFAVASHATALTSYSIFRTKEGTYEADLAAKVKELGAGQYYLSAQARDYDETAGGNVTEGTNSGPFSVSLSLYKNSTFTKVGDTTAAAISKDAYATTSGVFELDGTETLFRVMLNLKSSTEFTKEYILADDMQFFALNVSLKAEPAHIAEVNTEIPARAIAKNYNTYVGENWKETLGLPATVEVTTDGGATATANVIWDCSNVDFTQLGKQTITGTLTGDALLNSKSITVQQNIYVREATNLFTNPSFEGNYTGWHANYWQAPANSAAGYAIGMRGPAAVGNYAFAVASNATALTSYGIFRTKEGTYEADLAAKVKELGAGQYYLSAQARDYDETAGGNVTEGTNSGPFSVSLSLYKNSTFTKVGDTTAAAISKDAYATTSGVFELDGTETLFRVILNLKSSTAFTKEYILADDMQFFALNVEIAEPAFSGAACVLDNSLALRFNVPANQFGADFADPYVVFNFKGKETTVTEYTETTDGKYAFAFTNIAPHQITETVTATLYATYDGAVVEVDEQQYSVKKYCDKALADTATTAELKTLLADMLNYCAAVQTFKGQTDLVNAELDQNLATQTTPTLTNDLNTQLVVLDGATALWKGATLVLDDAVTIRLRFAIESIENVTVKITDGNENWEITDFIDNGDGTYYADFNGLHAAQMRKVIEATVCIGNTAISNTIAYSVVSYAHYAQDITTKGLGNLVKAMIKYGDSAVAYVNMQ